MSGTPLELDPYRTPALPDVPYSAGGGVRRPGWLTALCVLCIVMGALGIAGGLFGVGTTIMGRTIQALMRPQSPAGTNDEMEKVAQRMQAEIHRVQDRFYVWALISSLARIGVAAALLLGGIRALSLKESGRNLLVAACLAALMFELACVVLQTLINMETINVSNTFMEEVQHTLPETREGATAKTVLEVARVIMLVTIFFPYLLVAGKLVLYAWGALYLRRPAVRALFAV